MNIFQKIFSLILFGLILLSPSVVLAQSESKTNFDVPEYQGVDSSLTSFLCTPSDPPNGKDLETCINKGYRFGIAFGAISLVFFLVFAGYMYITGGEVGKEKGKSILKNALVGISLLLGSYLILSFINPSLVLFKPIQPPIFTAADMPSCEDVGLGVNCIIQDDNDTTANAGTGWGADMTCPSGQIVSAKGLGLPTKQADEQICKPFGEKLLALKTSLAGINWRITDTIGTGHVDPCHGSGSPVSGTCADIGLEPSDRTDANWDKLCKSVLAISNLQPVNEVIGAGTRLPNCPKEASYKRTGSNVHVNWKAGSGGGGGGTAGGGGSRPNCQAVNGVPGVCGDGGTSHAGLDWNNTDSALQPAYNSLKGKYPGIKVTQAFRSPEYGAHMRSVWEAKALMSGWSDSEVKSYGQYCTNLGIQYVTKADVDKFDASDKAWVNQHFVDHFSGLSSPTTCKSDHGSGIAFDIDGGANTKAFENAAAGFGLCHSVPNNMTAHGVRMNPDTRHWALKAKIPGGQCYSYAP